MSETNDQPQPSEGVSTPEPAVEEAPPPDPALARPWHGQENPFEALYQWVKAELGKK